MSKIRSTSTSIRTSTSTFLGRLRRDESGATAVEYGLIVGLIAVVLVVAVAALSGALGAMFDGITTVLTGNVPTQPTP